MRRRTSQMAGFNLSGRPAARANFAPARRSHLGAPAARAPSMGAGSIMLPGAGGPTISRRPTCNVWAGRANIATCRPAGRPLSCGPQVKWAALDRGAKTNGLGGLVCGKWLRRRSSAPNMRKRNDLFGSAGAPSRKSWIQFPHCARRPAGSLAGPRPAPERVTLTREHNRTGRTGRTRRAAAQFARGARARRAAGAARASSRRPLILRRRRRRSRPTEAGHANK